VFSPLPHTQTVLRHFAKGEKMPPRKLAEPEFTLLHQVIETMLAGNGGKYPESHSDMNYCVQALLKMYDVKRRPLAINLRYEDEAVEHRVQRTGEQPSEN
jgi:hypothetical protein